MTPVRLELAAPLSRVKHYTNEPLRPVLAHMEQNEHFSAEIATLISGPVRLF